MRSAGAMGLAGAVRRQLLPGGADPGVELFQRVGGARGASAVVGAARGVGGAQAVGDVGHVDDGVGHALPGVRVGVVVVMIVVVVLAAFNRPHALGGDDLQAFVAGALQQARHPAFITQAVGNHQLRLPDLARVRGRRLEDVRIAAQADQRLHRHALAADLLHQVAQDAEGGDHAQRLGGVGGRCHRAGQRGDQGDAAGNQQGHG